MATIACVASVSSRGSSRKLGQEQKKWMTGEGEGKEGTACPQTPRFWKTPFAHERSFWLARCGWCWLLSIRNINQTRYALFSCVTDLVSSDLWSQITNALDWYLLESCLCEGLWDQSLQSIIGDRAVETREGQFIENHGVRIWLEKMDCLLEITST